MDPDLPLQSLAALHLGKACWFQQQKQTTAHKEEFSCIRQNGTDGFVDVGKQPDW